MTYGIRRKLISCALNQYHVSGHLHSIASIRRYQLLPRLQRTIPTFPYRVGALQVDPFSVAIFSMVTRLFEDLVQPPQYCGTRKDHEIYILFSVTAVVSVTIK